MKKVKFRETGLTVKITILTTIVIFVSLVISGAFSVWTVLPFSVYRKS